MIDHRQTISPEGEVFSEQRLAHPTIPVTEAHARLTGQLYWDFLRRIGRPVLRVAERPSGAIDISLAGLRLLSFDTPVVIPWHEGSPLAAPPAPGALGQGWALRCPIAGGAAVHPAHAWEGWLQISLTPGAVCLTVQGFYPNLIRLHTRIYEWTQSALHYRVARGFLPLLAERLVREADRP